MTESRSMSCPSAAMFAELIRDLYARNERKRRLKVGVIRSSCGERNARRTR